MSDWCVQLLDHYTPAGYAVFLFDYRYWGGSQGEPRQLVWARHHVQDYIAAVKHIQVSSAQTHTLQPTKQGVPSACVFSHSHVRQYFTVMKLCSGFQQQTPPQPACPHAASHRTSGHSKEALIAAAPQHHASTAPPPYCTQGSKGLNGTVDQGRVILWGSSYSGGHALVTAAQLGCRKNDNSSSNSSGGSGSSNNNSCQVSAVVVMEPFLSARVLFKRALYLNACPWGRASPEGVAARAARVVARGDAGAVKTAAAGAMAALDTAVWAVAEAVRVVRLLLVACSDAMRAATGRPAVYVPLVLPKSEVAGSVRQGRTWLLRHPFLARLFAPLSMGLLSDDDYRVFMGSRPSHMLGGWRNLVVGHT